MSKKDYKKKQPVQPKPAMSITVTQQFFIALAIIAVLVLAYFAPIVFENKVPPSTDIIAWKGNAQSIIEARQQYDYNPMWANNVFSGMPAHLISLRPPFEQPARYLIEGLSKIIKWQTVYYLLGAVGMLLLMRFFKLSMIAASVSALAFIWWPNLMGLLEAGHNSKVQTIMLIPIILYTFLRLMKNANLLNFSLFAIAFSLAVRAGHYQIVFYTGLLLAFFGIVEVVQYLRQKDWTGAGARVGLVVLALALGVGMSAFNTIMTREYSEYSIRGGTGEEGSTGLGFDYAAQWSLHPGEMYNFIIPRFYGGHSSQHYTGDEVPQLKNRTIPGYWGHMPFTSSTDYMGVITLFLAAIGLVFSWKRREVRILLVFSIFALLLAFGRHFPYLFKLFLNYMPFFNKFRVPTMIVVMVLFSASVVAGFGLQALLDKTRDMDKKILWRRIGIIFGVFALFGIVPLLLRNALPLASARDLQVYDPQILNLLKVARFELLKGDALRMLGLVAVMFFLVYAYIKSWLSKPFFVGAVLALLIFDLFNINSRYMQNLIPESRMESIFSKTELDEFLQKDTEMHRIFPLGQLSDQAHWPYHHQSIEGYHPAKLRIYQDLREACLLNGTAPGFNNSEQAPINWNVVNMLNCKYLLAQGNIEHGNVMPIYQDKQQEIVVYQNRAALPRVWAVGETEVIADREDRLARLNNPQFDPAVTAIVEEALDETIAAPTEWQADVTRYESNYIDVQVETDTKTLLVLSEIFYPAGWKAFIGNEQLEIEPLNHVLRGVVVPAGEHVVEFKLEPESYYNSRTLMAICMVLVYAALIVALVPVIRRKKV